MQIYPLYTKKELNELGFCGELPRHIGIIMDGNGRWARSRLMPRSMGHRAGMEILHSIVLETRRIGVEALTVYAFSTENWRRPVQEINALFSLLEEYFKREIDELDANDVKIIALGELEPFPDRVRSVMLEAIERTKNNRGLRFCVAINYGGRAEITRAVKRMAEAGLHSEAITDDVIGSYLYTCGIPDPDLIIRTAGEQRLSNFLLWQAAYSEFVFKDEPWPEFTPQVYFDCIKEYMKRTRRFGKVVE